VDDFRKWPFSSYQAICSTRSTKVARAKTLEWFGGKEEFEAFHQIESDLEIIAEYIENE